MAHLPPVGWADLATRRDLDHLGEVLRMEIAGGADRLRSEMYQALAAQTRTFVFAMIGAVVSATGLAFAAARFGL